MTFIVAIKAISVVAIGAIVGFVVNNQLKKDQATAKFAKLAGVLAGIATAAVWAIHKAGYF